MIADDGELEIPLIQFRRERLFNTRLAEHRRIRLTECQFADDSALLAVRHAGAERALSSFRDVAGAFGLSVNMSKTKFMAAGAGIVDADQTPLDGVVDHVEAFRYVGCHVTPDARSSFDVSRRVAAASGAFCTLRESVFGSDDFSIAIKRIVYGVTVLAVFFMDLRVGPSGSVMSVAWSPFTCSVCAPS